ncbi:uncharacterized protein TRUGW13939_02228 [Talaromyces rugulosus]|uniref:Uncharacterized protein n=1 Tax=Talaromyces rugulosus TaxID=121627 RepID=A0A7H8QMN9_TALRU|nr:uncharacterized protein TRUGW13939_02228 [Talaromyces rugulosus]QKX55136.1 hypothetical protein TRUGW13939_02228 [Talaromyces rugulosus]
MPTTRSQARSINMLGKGHSQPAAVPPESPFAAISTTTINQNSSLFNYQASTQPSMFRPENQPTPSPGQTGGNSLFGNWTPSQQPSQNNTRPLFARDDSMPSPFTQHNNTPSLFSMSPNTVPVSGSGYRPFVNPFVCKPPIPHPPSVFGIRIDCKPGCNHYVSLQEEKRKSQPLKDNSLPPEEYEEARQERIAKVSKILEKVNCLDDLTEDVVRELMATDYGLLAIMKFKVTLLEWAEWSEPMKLKELPVELKWEGWENITIQCGRGIRLRRENPVSDKHVSPE